MIFHTIDTMTIGGFADMQLENNLKYLLRFNIWAPQRILVKKRKKIIEQFNKLTNEKEVNKLISKDMHRLKMLNTINIQYKIMIRLLELVGKFNDKGMKKVLDELYHDRYGKYPTTQADYGRIRKDNNLLIRKFNQQAQGEEVETSPEFKEILARLELILAPMQIRDKKLSTFGIYTALASEKIKGNG